MATQAFTQLPVQFCNTIFGQRVGCLRVLAARRNKSVIFEMTQKDDAMVISSAHLEIEPGVEVWLVGAASAFVSVNIANVSHDHGCELHISRANYFAAELNAIR